MRLVLTIATSLVAILACAAVAAIGTPAAHQDGLTTRQARLIVRSYADVNHLGQFRILYCRRRARTRIACWVEESGYYDPTGFDRDRYWFGVRRVGCAFLVSDGGSGSSGAWERWL